MVEPEGHGFLRFYGNLVEIVILWIFIHISVVVFDHFVANQALRHGNGKRVEFVNNLF